MQSPESSHAASEELTRGSGEETRRQTTAEYDEADLKWALMKDEKRVHSGLAFLLPRCPREALNEGDAVKPRR